MNSIYSIYYVINTINMVTGYWLLVTGYWLLGYLQ